MRGWQTAQLAKLLPGSVRTITTYEPRIVKSLAGMDMVLTVLYYDLIIHCRNGIVWLHE